MPALVLPSAGVSPEGGLSVVNSPSSGPPVMCWSVCAPSLGLSSLMAANYPKPGARSLFRRAHHQALDGVFLGDRGQCVDNRALQVPAYLLGQGRPVLLGDRHVVLIVVAGARRVHAQHQHRPGLVRVVGGAAVDGERGPGGDVAALRVLADGPLLVAG